MPDYRVYRLTPDGHVGAPAEVISCADDSEAVAQGRALLGDKDLEIWLHDRRITTLRHCEPQP